MVHFSISISPQCFHLPICLSSVYFLSLSPCLSVVYGVWEMRYFASGTSQVNLKFRFIFFNVTLINSVIAMECVPLSNSVSMSFRILSVPGTKESMEQYSCPHLCICCNTEVPVV